MKNIFFKISFLFCMVLLVGAGCISFSGGSDKSAGPAGMYVSIDKGESWQQINKFPTSDGVKSLSDTNVYRIVDDPQDPKAMYWLSRAQGLFYTYNDGKAWQQVQGPLERGFIYSLSVHPKNKCTLISTNGEKVYKSEDCSRSWDEIYRESRPDVRVASVAFDPFSPYAIFVLEANGDLLKSDNGGESWRVIHRFKKSSIGIEVDPKEQDLLYVTTKTSGLYRSIDGGETWESLKKPLSKFSKGLSYRRFLVHPTEVGGLYWISTYGILVSDDYGDSWGAMNLITPPGTAQIYGFDSVLRSD